LKEISVEAHRKWGVDMALLMKERSMEMKESQEEIEDIPARKVDRSSPFS
jgi:hypothetical protein